MYLYIRIYKLFKLDIRKKIFCNQGGEALEQVS